MDAAASIFRKLGIDPESRFSESDQDFEYTSCKIEELGSYLDLYKEEETTNFEKRVLGCFILECLNEYILKNGEPHKLLHHALTLLENDRDIHKTELAYWASLETQNPKDWWAIAKYIRKQRNT